MKKDGSASEFLLKVQKIVDSLAVGAPVSVEEHIEVILDGLGREYATFITFVVPRKEPYTVDEIDALLSAQEERIESLIEKNSVQCKPIWLKLPCKMQNEIHQRVVEEGKVEVVTKGEAEEAPDDVVDQIGTTTGLNVKFATSMVILPGSAITVLT